MGRRECRDIESRLSKLDYKHHIARLHTERDRTGHMLAWLLREVQAGTLIGTIRGSDGTIYNTQLQINYSFVEFYRTL